MAWEPPSAAAADLIRITVAPVIEQPAALVEEMTQAIFAAQPVLRSDESLAAEVVASSRANVLRWLGVTAQRPGDRVGPDVAPEALDIARDLVRRGIEREALVNAYQQGQNIAWRRVMTEMVATARTDPAYVDVLDEALDVTARSLFRFVDDVLTNIAAQIDRERDQLVSADLAQRLATVQLVLEGAPISDQRAGARLGYELGGEHLAVVLWTADADDEPGTLERAAESLARAAGTRRPFIVPAGSAGLWAWLHTPQAGRLDVPAQALPPGARVALGSVASGAAGFRRSHREALAVQRLVRSRADSGTLTAYADVEIAILGGTDPERASQFVTRTLGGLLDTRPELRATLRVYLQEQGSVSRAAARLFMHRNTVQNRVARAEALLPRPIGSRPLAVALALELEHWLGVEP